MDDSVVVCLLFVRSLVGGVDGGYLDDSVVCCCSFVVGGGVAGGYWVDSDGVVRNCLLLFVVAPVVCLLLFVCHLFVIC